MKQSLNYSNDKSLSHYLFIRSNISIKRKSSKKRSGCEDYFNRFDLLNYFKWLLFSTTIKALSLSLKTFNIINESNTLTFNIIKYEIKLSTTMWILNTFSRINKWLIILSKHSAETNSNNFVIWSTWNLVHKCICFETSLISNKLLFLWKLIGFHNSTLFIKSSMYHFSAPANVFYWLFINALCAIAIIIIKFSKLFRSIYTYTLSNSLKTIPSNVTIFIIIVIYQLFKPIS